MIYKLQWETSAMTKDERSLSPKSDSASEQSSHHQTTSTPQANPLVQKYHNPHHTTKIDVPASFAPKTYLQEAMHLTIN